MKRVDPVEVPLACQIREFLLAAGRRLRLTAGVGVVLLLGFNKLRLRMLATRCWQEVYSTS